MQVPFRSVTSMDDIRAIEQMPWQGAVGAQSTYELIANAAAKFGAAPAIEYLPTVDPAMPPVRITNSLSTPSHSSAAPPPRVGSAFSCITLKAT